jgi:5-methylcytosine-specific restriction endonuclease McrA
MALATLKPRLSTLKATSKVKVLDTKAGTTKRIRGRAWMRERQTALVNGSFTCVDCGLISITNEVDHDTPLEQGGLNDQSNYRVRCIDCHKAKTAREAGSRAGRFGAS